MQPPRSVVGAGLRPRLDIARQQFRTMEVEVIPVEPEVQYPSDGEQGSTSRAIRATDGLMPTAGPRGGRLTGTSW